jgi:hypothetical protein
MLFVMVIPKIVFSLCVVFFFLHVTSLPWSVPETLASRENVTRTDKVPVLKLHNFLSSQSLSAEVAVLLAR